MSGVEDSLSFHLQIMNRRRGGVVQTRRELIALIPDALDMHKNAIVAQHEQRNEERNQRLSHQELIDQAAQFRSDITEEEQFALLERVARRRRERRRKRDAKQKKTPRVQTRERFFSFRLAAAAAHPPEISLSRCIAGTHRADAPDRDCAGFEAAAHHGQLHDGI